MNKESLQDTSLVCSITRIILLIPRQTHIQNPYPCPQYPSDESDIATPATIILNSPLNSYPSHNQSLSSLRRLI